MNYFLQKNRLFQIVFALYVVVVAYAAPLAMLAEFTLLHGYYRLAVLSWVPLLAALYFWLSKGPAKNQRVWQSLAVAVLIFDTLLNVLILPRATDFSGVPIGGTWAFWGVLPLYAVLLAYAFGDTRKKNMRPDPRILQIAVRIYGIGLCAVFGYVLLGILVTASTEIRDSAFYVWAQLIMVLTGTMAVGVYWLWALNKRPGKQLYWRVIVVGVLLCQIAYSGWIGFSMSSDGFMDQLIGSLLLFSMTMLGALPTWLVAFAYAFVPWKKTSPKQAD